MIICARLAGCVLSSLRVGTRTIIRAPRRNAAGAPREAPGNRALEKTVEKKRKKNRVKKNINGRGGVIIKKYLRRCRYRADEGRKRHARTNGARPGSTPRPPRFPTIILLRRAIIGTVTSSSRGAEKYATGSHSPPPESTRAQGGGGVCAARARQTIVVRTNVRRAYSLVFLYVQNNTANRRDGRRRRRRQCGTRPF